MGQINVDGIVTRRHGEIHGRIKTQYCSRRVVPSDSSNVDRPCTDIVDHGEQSCCHIGNQKLWQTHFKLSGAGRRHDRPAIDSPAVGADFLVRRRSQLRRSDAVVLNDDLRPTATERAVSPSEPGDIRIDRRGGHAGRLAGDVGDIHPGNAGDVGLHFRRQPMADIDAEGVVNETAGRVVVPVDLLARQGPLVEKYRTNLSIPGMRTVPANTDPKRRCAVVDESLRASDRCSRIDADPRLATTQPKTRRRLALSRRRRSGGDGD